MQLHFYYSHDWQAKQYSAIEGLVKYKQKHTDPKINKFSQENIRTLRNPGNGLSGHKIMSLNTSTKLSDLG